MFCSTSLLDVDGVCFVWWVGFGIVWVGVYGSEGYGNKRPILLQLVIFPGGLGVVWYGWVFCVFGKTNKWAIFHVQHFVDDAVEDVGVQPARCSKQHISGVLFSVWSSDR